MHLVLSLKPGVTRGHPVKAFLGTDHDTTRPGSTFSEIPFSTAG